MFIYWQDMHMAVLLLYVDDIVLTSCSSTLLSSIISCLQWEFAISDLGTLNYFLGIFVTHSSFKLYLSLYSKYAHDFLIITICLLPTLFLPLSIINISFQWLISDFSPNATKYWSIIGALQYHIEVVQCILKIWKYS